MSAAPELDPAPAGRRALLVGRAPAVMDSVLDELRVLGFAAVGETDPERAADRPDAGAFDVVAIGRGITGEMRAGLRRRFLARNPRARLLDVTLREAAGRVAGALSGHDPEAVDLGAYFARIGYAGPVGVSLETLQALVAAHQNAIPFENLDVVAGRGVDISPGAVDAKLIGARRGGYCYEQNGLFGRVLAALGFEVDALMARVLMGQQPGRPLGRSHMTLKVTIGEEAFLTDVGFGGFVPPTPLPLGSDAPQTTPHERYRVSPFGPLKVMEVETEGESQRTWAPMYEFSQEPQLAADYEAANWFTSTHPSSFFTRRIVAARTAPDARYALFGRRLTIRRPGETPERHELDAEGITVALAETFRLPVAQEWRPAIEAAAEPG